VNDYPIGLDAYLTRENDPGSIRGTDEPILLRCTQCGWRGSWTGLGLHWFESGHKVVTEQAWQARMQEQHEAAKADPRRS
jgi:hypothetical protein